MGVNTLQNDSFFNFLQTKRRYFFLNSNFLYTFALENIAKG
jgi:hypothetical protein